MRRDPLAILAAWQENTRYASKVMAEWLDYWSPVTRKVLV